MHPSILLLCAALAVSMAGVATADDLPGGIPDPTPPAPTSGDPLTDSTRDYMPCRPVCPV